ncbi:hypothetical protein HPB50_020164 [Hyalomma asiaticum]|uniref:Uncharacterized protein n=1 Tax=Hyalomma asiaticum TaxID=266040 RepID=A0ACB7TQF6_HYAAI|nr:hypothetical protein HPB50_020164 [Hyalomma asiaticum]
MRPIARPSNGGKIWRHCLRPVLVARAVRVPVEFNYWAKMAAPWPSFAVSFSVRNAPQQTENGIAALGDEYAWHLGSSPRCVPIFFALGIPGPSALSWRR